VTFSIEKKKAKKRKSREEKRKFKKGVKDWCEVATISRLPKNIGS